jgi:hypothetical protein
MAGRRRRRTRAGASGGELDLRVERRGGVHRLVDAAAGRVAADARGRELDGGGHRRRAVVERLASDLRALARAAGRSGALRQPALRRAPPAQVSIANGRDWAIARAAIAAELGASERPLVGADGVARVRDPEAPFDRPSNEVSAGGFERPSNEVPVAGDSR